MINGLPTAVLGRTGLEVTRLGYGGADLANRPGGRRVREDEARTILHAILDTGINFIDTANDYGESEAFIGRSIAARRSEFFLASKCGCAGPAGGEHIWTRENLFRGLHESLERLRTDYVDLIQLHNPSVEECESGRLVDVLNDMRRSGKVRWIGVSTTLPNLPPFIKGGAFDTFQIPYSGLERAHEEWIAKAAEASIGTIIRGGVARGDPALGLGPPQRGAQNLEHLPENKPGKPTQMSDARTQRWGIFERANLDELRSEGESRTAFLLRFTLAHPDVHTIIVATLRPEHLEENVRAVQAGPLPAETYGEAKRRLANIGEAPDLT